MSGTGDTRGARAAPWSIQERTASPGGPAVYDVYRAGRRVAWGLKDRAAAQRWIARLGGATSPDTGRKTAATATRVWWDERD